MDGYFGQMERRQCQVEVYWAEKRMVDGGILL